MVTEEEEKKGKNMEVENNLYLSEDCIWEILLRSSVKSLVRFKCVCKTWFSLISDPKFAESQFVLSAKPSRGLIYYQNSTLQFIDLDALFHNDPPRNHILPPQFARSNKITISCKGFVLSADKDEFILWNPATGAQKRIFYPHILSNDNLYGFGYDASMNDYLIVVVVCSRYRISQVEVFSLRTNSWTKIEPLDVDKDAPRFTMNGAGLLLNGAIHWYSPTYDSILAFDLIERRFSSIDLPWRVTSVPRRHHLHAIGGYLTIASMTRRINSRIYINVIWVMKIYKDESSWTRYELNNDFSRLIDITNCGDFVGLDSNGRLVKYNDKGELLKRSISSYCNTKYGYAAHVENLLPLPNDSDEAGEDD